MGKKEKPLCALRASVVKHSRKNTSLLNLLENCCGQKWEHDLMVTD